MPIEATRRVQAESVDGDTEVVLRTDERTVGGGEPSITEVGFAVDRETAEAGTPPEGAEDVTDADGLVFTLPVDPSTEEGDYVVLGPVHDAVGPGDLRGRGDLRRPRRLPLPVGRRRRAGRPRGARPADHVAEGQLPALAPGLTGLVDQGLLDALPGVLPSLPDEIPIAWTSRTTTFVDADQELGATIAGGSTQEITGSLDLGLTVVDVPFATIDVYSTDDSIDERGSDVGDDSSLLNLIGTVLPIVATVLGLLLLVAALLLARRAARRPTGTPPAAGATAGAHAA